MERAAVMELEAGRELDALVAEKVYGRTVDREHHLVDVGMPYWQTDTDDHLDDGGYVPAYSTDIAAAWVLIGDLIGDGDSVSFDCTDEGDPERWWSVLIGAESADHPSLMVALCRAALLNAEGD